VIRQCKYLNNIVERDHRAVKRITRPLQGFKDFRCAGIILSGVELMLMIRKGQMRDDGRGLSAHNNSTYWRSNTDRIAHQEARLCRRLYTWAPLTRQNPSDRNRKRQGVLGLMTRQATFGRRTSARASPTTTGDALSPWASAFGARVVGRNAWHRGT
jgi:hypothetical protein